MSTVVIEHQRPRARAIVVSALTLATATCSSPIEPDLACSQDTDCHTGFSCINRQCIDPSLSRIAGPFRCQDLQETSDHEMLKSPLVDLAPSLKTAKMYLCPKGFAIVDAYFKTMGPEPNVDMTLRCVRFVQPEDVDKIEAEYSLILERAGVRACPEGMLAVGAEYYLPALYCARISGNRRIPFVGGEVQYAADERKCGEGKTCCPPGTVMTAWHPYTFRPFCRRLGSWDVNAPVCQGP